MTDPQVAVFMLGIFIFTILLGFPICFTLMAMGVAFGYYAYYDAERMQSIFDNSTLTSDQKDPNKLWKCVNGSANMYSPLHVAVDLGITDAVRALLHNGGNVAVAGRNLSGQTDEDSYFFAMRGVWGTARGHSASKGTDTLNEAR